MLLGFRVAGHPLMSSTPVGGEARVRDKHLGSVMTRGGRLSFALLVFAATLLAADWAGAQLRVRSIDWVQGRPEIPHPALNNRATILMAIAEGGGCGGNYQYRWDINGDGDFDDGNEGWRGTNAGGHRGGRWGPAWKSPSATTR